MLSRDLSPKGNLIVCLVLNNTKYNRAKPINSRTYPQLEQGKIDFHLDDWLKVEGYFLDETHFLLTASEFIQTRSGWKKGSVSGKSKYKSKSRSHGTELSLTLTYVKQQYGELTLLREVKDAVKLPVKILLKQLKVTDKRISLIVKVHSYLSDNVEIMYKTITMMFLSLYQVLNLAEMLYRKEVNQKKLN